MNPASAADNDAAPEAPTGAIRTQQSRAKKASGTTIAKRACDQCKFRKIKAIPPFFENNTPFNGGIIHANLLWHLYSAAYRSHAGHVSPWALNALFSSLRRNEAQLDSE